MDHQSIFKKPILFFYKSKEILPFMRIFVNIRA